MLTTSCTRARRACALLPRLACSLALVALPWVAEAAPPKTGVTCTAGPNFTLDAKAGYIQLPDGNTMFMWSYAPGGGGFQYPGPVLCVNQGDTVSVSVNNTLSVPVSIVFPGQENVMANGEPAQPQGSGATLSSLTNVALPGQSITYSFVASRAGTFIYQSGTNPQMQVRMGLVGALVVRPTAGADRLANGTADSRFTPTEEFMVLLSEIDPYLNQAVETGGAFNLGYYHPRYWLINGRGFPDSIADNNDAAYPNQPYGALAHIYPYDIAAHPYPGAIRYLNVGTEEFPFHPHANNGVVVARDGGALEGTTGDDLSFEKFAVNIGPGQTWDVTFKWHDREKYSLANPVPMTIPQVNNQEFGMFYSGSPYLGVKGPLPPGASTLNVCGEYMVISHNHALYQITSWGVNLTGPITYLRVDPPLPNSCP